MTIVLLILAGVAAVSAARALAVVREHRRKQAALRERLGDEYDAYLRYRNERRRRGGTPD